MTPIYFGHAKRRLFGIFDPAKAGTSAPRAALLCHPAGDEQVHAYRTFRQLALRMSQAGRHVLRFDYYGTGDSFGATAEGDVVGWCDDIETAIAELKDMTGAAKVSLVGLRLGANLAARVAAKRPDDIESLVLWEPLRGVKNGGDWSSDHGDPPLVDPLSLGRGVPERTFVLLNMRGTQSGALQGLSVKRLETVKPWIEERTMSGTIPLDALHCVVNWLK